jgi:hypothetical protein
MKPGPISAGMSNWLRKKERVSNFLYPTGMQKYILSSKGVRFAYKRWPLKFPEVGLKLSLEFRPSDRFRHTIFALSMEHGFVFERRAIC